VLSLTALVGLLSGDGGVDAGRLGLALLAMLGSQLAIGWMNDYRDRDYDGAQQPSKPVPSRLVDARCLPPASIGALAVSLAAGVALGPTPLLFLVIGTAAGLAHDFGVKDSRLSALPFALGIGVLPPFVWWSLDVYRPELLGLYVVGTPLAIAAHLANVLPDIETDAALGRRSIAVALGRGRTLASLVVCLASSPLLAMATLPFIDYDARMLAATVAGYTVLVSAAMLAYRSPARTSSVLAFRLIVVASVGFAAGWLAAVA
jgi:4-hydroxybenzoate polyprenyltransferase